MLKTMWFLFVLIAIIKYSDVQGSFYDNMTCANCSGVNENCRITTTGWGCDFEYDAQNLIVNGDSSGIPRSLGKCMLPRMAFKKKRALHGYCCIWSPKIGCQKLKVSDGQKDLCYRCTRATWTSVMDGTVCPCGPWFMQRVSSEMMHKPWHFLLITNAMLIIILNF